MFAAVHESLHGTKRQFARCKAMSGVGGKADLPVERPDFSLDPKPTLTSDEALS